MASHIRNLLKQIPFYGKTIKLRIKNLLMLNYYLSYHFFKNLKKPKLNNRVLKNY